MQGIDNKHSIFTINEIQVEKAMDTITDVSLRLFSTSPFHLLKNPRLQVFGGLAALGYGVYYNKKNGLNYFFC